MRTKRQAEKINLIILVQEEKRVNHSKEHSEARLFSRTQFISSTGWERGLAGLHINQISRETEYLFLNIH